jgi:hypothetical protein
METQDNLNLENIKPVETQGLDLWQFDKKEIEIESAAVLQVPSKFVETDAKMQWVMRVLSKPVATIGEGDDKFDFRASELFNLVQDDKGDLKGFPTGDGSNLMKFLKDIRVQDPEKLQSLKAVVDAMIGKKGLIKCYDKVKDGKKSTFLRFRY